MNENFQGFRPRAKLEQFTAIPNELFDSVMKDLNGNELKILLTIFRNTYGWVKGVDKKGNAVYKVKEEISISIFKEKTGMSSNTIRKYLKILINKGYIEKHYDHDAKKQKAACYSVKQNPNKYSPPSSSEGDKKVVPPSSSEGALPQGLNPSKKEFKENNKEEEEEGKLSTNIKTIFEKIFQRKISPFEESQLHSVEENQEIIIKALKLTALNSKNRTLNYTISLLKDWQEKGITSVQEVDKMIEEYKNTNTTRKSNNKKKVKDPTEGMTEEEKEEYYKELGYR